MIDVGGREVTLQSEQLNIDTNRFRARLNSAIGLTGRSMLVVRSREEVKIVRRAVEDRLVGRWYWKVFSILRDPVVNWS